MNAGALIIALILIAAWGVTGYRLGKRRGRPGLGTTLCVCLGVIGLGIFMLIPRTAEAQARRDREQAQAGRTDAEQAVADITP